MNWDLLIIMTTSFLTAVVVTPIVAWVAVVIGATDKPNERKIHQLPMPRIGGVAIFISTAFGYLLLDISIQETYTVAVGALIIFLLGFLDDLYGLSAVSKLIGQLIAALFVVFGGLKIDVLTIPFLGVFSLQEWAVPVTILWIIGITNAINLIDGLDGLAAGISFVVIATIAFLAATMGNELVLLMSFPLLGCLLGFLFYNFYPAKIFMGDSGSLFLGYSIAVLSLLGFYKSVTFFSIMIPLIILGVPLFDTFFAIIRRVVNNRPISAPDKGHLHHRLLSMGFSHRGAVLVMYGLSIFFSVIAIILSNATLVVSIVMSILFFFIVELIAEIVGLVSERYKPFLFLFSKFVRKDLNKI